MMKTSMRRAAVALALAALQAHAASAATQVTFSGVVTSPVGGSVTVGESIAGSFTLIPDPAWSNDFGVAGQSVDIESSFSLGAAPLLVSGSATFQDGRVLSLSSMPASQRFFERVVRDGRSDGIDLLAQTDPSSVDSVFLRVALNQSQADCAAQCLFVDPAGGLSALQAIDWTAPGVQAVGYYGGSTATGSFFGAFDLTSLSITALAVPEPTNFAMMLAAVGLLGAMVRRRHS